ncbi:MAG: glycosyltransferase family 2 protein [Kiritimatiellaeota bacterium]|nr:glycosyltransferase family 2 protein [Kiritimatiellota bacterium]
MTNPPAPSLNLSIILITLNEERRLERCLASLPAGAELIVVDSLSTDRTRAIAASFGARFVTRPFTTHGDQKNAALDLATRDWVFAVDADEVLDPALRAQLETRARRPPADLAFRVRRQLVFLGRTLRFGRTVDHPLRLFPRGSGRFTAELHDRVALTQGRAVRLRSGRLLHHSYDDLDDYFARFNRYTALVARERHARGKTGAVGLWTLRPWSEFLERYVLRLGFLDGYPGYCCALFNSWYVFVKYAKLQELAQRAAPASTSR